MPFAPMAAIGLLASLLLGAHALHAEPGGRTLAFALLTGGLLGLVLQRSRFCFYCHARDWFEDGNPRGALLRKLSFGRTTPNPRRSYATTSV